MKFVLFYLPSVGTYDQTHKGMAGINKQNYQNMLWQVKKQIEAADDMGYWGAAFTEHHFHIEGLEQSNNPILLSLYFGQNTKNIRVGQMANVLPFQNPLRLAEDLAMLDHMMKGRLTLNVISSDFPGEVAESSLRYQRSREVVEILKQAWTQDEINYEGEVYNFKNVPTAPATPYQTGGPLLYFGGYSPAALDLCGQHCDVYLMWPEKEDELAGRMKAVNAVAEKYDRTLDYGLRVHMIVRDTEKEAQEYAEYITSKLDDDYGRMIRHRALDSTSLGVSHQAANRALADEFGYIEPNLWTGVGRARSGCGAALVGSADQILSKIETYQKMGMRAFVFSGYPHIEEADHFGRLVMPHLDTCSLPQAYGRVPTAPPMTPLAAGVRR